MKLPLVNLADILKSADVFVDGDWVESKDQDVNGDVRLIQLADIGDGYYINKSSRFLTSDKARELRCTFLEKGDVLLARMPEPLGRACIFPSNPKKSVTVVDVCIIRLKPETHDPRWLMHCLNAPVCRNQIADFATGTTRTRISRGNLAKIKVPLSPLAEQKRIAEILDRTQSLISKRKEAIAKLDTLTQSIFLEMFGKPAINPKGWIVSKLANIAEKITDGEHQTPQRTLQGIKLLSARNIQNGYIDVRDVDYIGIEEYERIKKRCNPERGDILISCSGTIGRVATVETDEPFSLVRSVAILKLKHDLINSKFLEYFLRTPELNSKMKQRANASSQANLFQNQIRELPALLPPLPLQKEFAQRVEAVEKLKATHRVSLSQLEALFDSLQHRAFKGEL